MDGFRVDVLYHLIKDDQFRDNPPNPDYADGDDPAHRWTPLYTADRPEMQQLVADMRRVVDAFSDARSSRVLIGELYLPLARLVAYYGANAEGVLEGVQLPFNFQLIGTEWQARRIDRLVRDYEAALPAGAAPNWVLGNHDKPRIASRVGAQMARLAAMLLLTLRGTPTLYYGDEIGMTDVAVVERRRTAQRGCSAAAAPRSTDAAGDSRLVGVPAPAARQGPVAHQASIPLGALGWVRATAHLRARPRRWRRRRPAG